MILAEFSELVLPLVPEFGESMEKQDERALSRRYDVQAHTVHFHKLFLEHGFVLEGGRSRRGEQTGQEHRDETTFCESMGHVGRLARTQGTRGTRDQLFITSGSGGFL